MPDISVSKFNHVSETLLIPLYCRAEESRQPQPILRDDKAVEIVERINYDFSKFAGQKLQVVTAALRAREFDRAVKEFLVIHPTGVIVNLGCGLDARSERADNGEAYWFDLDFPEVIAVRRQFFFPSQTGTECLRLRHWMTTGLSWWRNKSRGRSSFWQKAFLCT